MLHDDQESIIIPLSSISSIIPINNFYAATNTVVEDDDFLEEFDELDNNSDESETINYCTLLYGIPGFISTILSTH